MIPSRKQIAGVLGVTPETATKFLKSIGITNRILDSNDLKILRQSCHPLFWDMSREKLAKIYKRHTETLARDLKQIEIHHQAKLSYADLKNIYWKFDWPKWILPLGIQNEYPTRANVEMFYKQIDVEMNEKWYEFYFVTLGTEELSRNSANSYFDPMDLQYVWSPPR